MPLDDASRALVAELSESGTTPVSDLTPGIVRLWDPILSAKSGPGPSVGEVENLKLTAADGGKVRVRVLKPSRPARALLVYFHGGGWVAGDIDFQYDHVARDLVTATRSSVVLVNYRKAPEHPFPAAVDDSYLALSWAARHAATLAAPGAPLIVAGDSAGGNIAAVMAQWSRDRGGPAIGLQILVYPAVDCDFTRPSYLAPDNQLLLDSESMQWYWDKYVPDPEARKQPSASPIRATDLSGLPPALVYVAAFDPLHDEGVAYADALRGAGVDVTLQQAHDQMHGFFQLAGLLPGYDVGIRLVADHINARITQMQSEVTSHG